MTPDPVLRWRVEQAGALLRRVAAPVTGGNNLHHGRAYARRQRFERLAERGERPRT